MNFQDWFGGKFEEKEARSNQNGAGKQESRTKNEGDAILGALEADERDSGKDKSQEASNNRKVALEGGIRVKGDGPDPKCDQENAQEGDCVPKGGSRPTATVIERGFAHNSFLAGRAFLLD